MELQTCFSAGAAVNWMEGKLTNLRRHIPGVHFPWLQQAVDVVRHLTRHFQYDKETTYMATYFSFDRHFVWNTYKVVVRSAN